jgi:hypothetical protein
MGDAARSSTAFRQREVGAMMTLMPSAPPPLIFLASVLTAGVGYAMLLQNVMAAILSAGAAAALLIVELIRNRRPNA